MNENRSLWTWLVNLNIDGIVTNYTALGHEFQALKAAAVTTDINDLGANSSTTPLPIYENPYQPTLRHEQLAPETPVMISSMVTIAGNTYYQIGDNAFVPATTVNLAPQTGWASLFINQNAVVTGKNFACQYTLIRCINKMSLLTSRTIRAITSQRHGMKAITSM